MQNLTLHRTIGIESEIKSLGEHGFVLTIKVRDDDNKQFEIDLFSDLREILETIYDN